MYIRLIQIISRKELLQHQISNSIKYFTIGLTIGIGIQLITHYINKTKSKGK